MRKLLPSLTFLAVAALPAQAEPVRSVSVAYNVDVGPMTMIVVKYALNHSGDAVEARANIRSNGLSRMFSEYSAKAEGQSRAGQEGMTPVRFRLVREKEDRKKETSLQWNGPGAITYAPQEKKPERRQRIEQALNAAVADPMTAVLRIGTSGETPCPSVQQVFDGRDVYELSLADKGEGRLDGEAAYRGPVRVCEVSWTPIAGRAAEKNEPRESYEVSFAPIGELPSGRMLWLPVSLTGKLKGIRFDAYVTKLKAEGGSEGTAASQN